MCINAKYSMSIIERVFKCEETELSVIKCQNDIWFRGKTIAEILGHSNPLKAIRTHVDSEDKKEISKLEPTPLRIHREGQSTLTNQGYSLLSFDTS